MRDYLVKGISGFFKGRYWGEFMERHLVRREGEEVYHAHLYVDTCIHPDSMYAILPAYFESIGRPLDRSMHAQSPRSRLGCIHGIHPVGCPHWEFIFRYNKETVLERCQRMRPRRSRDRICFRGTGRV